MLSDEEASDYFTPSKEAQTFRILQGLCPHNQGWYFFGHGHSDDCYRCCMCGEMMWY